MNPARLAVVTAGLSVPSSTRLLADRLATAVGRHLADAGRPVEVETAELRELAVDIAHNLVTGFPPPALRDTIGTMARADGLIAVTPVFSASYSGLFKSFFDVVDRDVLAGKPVLIAATGGTARHSLALEHAVRPLFAYLRATVAPTAVFAAPEDWGASTDTRTTALAERVDRAAAELSALMTGHRPPPAADEVTPFADRLAALRVPPHP
ncbi:MULTISPECIES: FMN reductase [Streptomyces]|uniref:Oxidoreductase n=2 Tax=Streptomyces TaxID=1883 RepID=A0A117IX97_9ACTN|nr:MULTISPECIES: FMN reductase [Streptomyces]KUH40293.1 oxidoreductase [Streptomyces kanasensis]UUS34289.1 FMN reductase [Streptomyces changanensis]